MARCRWRISSRESRKRGYDETNAVLRKAMAKCLVDVMDKRRLRRNVERAGRRKGVIVWKLT